jgi:hypothetical protein
MVLVLDSTVRVLPEGSETGWSANRNEGETMELKKAATKRKIRQ